MPDRAVRPGPVLSRWELWQASTPTRTAQHPHLSASVVWYRARYVRPPPNHRDGPSAIIYPGHRASGTRSANGLNFSLWHVPS